MNDLDLAEMPWMQDNHHNNDGNHWRRYRQLPIMDPRRQAASELRENMLEAVRSGSVTEVKQCIAFGAEVDQSYGGQRLLHVAIAANHTEVVAILLSRGAEPNSSAEYECSPLQLAVTNANFHIVQLLLDAGANVHINVEPNLHKHDLLHEAVMRRHEEMIQLLCIYGADINATDTRGLDVLGYAAKQNDWVTRDSLFKLLISCGARVLPDGANGENAPFHAFLRNGTVQGLQSYIDHGVELRDIRNRPLLHSSVQNGHHAELTTFLLDTGIFDIDLMDSVHSTPLHIAVTNNIRSCVSSLLRYGANPNSLDGFDQTPLYIAVTDAKLSSVKLLLEYDAQIYTNTCWDLLKSVIEKSNGFRRHPHALIARALIKHIALLQSRSCEVDPDDLNLIQQYTKELTFFNTCKGELACLKSSFIENTAFTYYDILVSGNAYQYVSNDHVIDAFKDGKSILNKFPNFGERLSRRFVQLQDKLRHMQEAMSGLNHIVPFDVSAFPSLAFGILSYLRIVDLKRLSNV